MSQAGEDPKAGLKTEGRFLVPRCWRSACIAMGSCTVLAVVTMGIVAATGGFSAAPISVSNSGVVTIEESSFAVPEWKLGAVFEYSITASHRGASGGQRNVSKTVRVVNAAKDPATHHYMLAADNAESALDHAVLNGFPFLGRVATIDLGVYEDGAPQPLFGFWPMKAAMQDVQPWHFRLFQRNWEGSVVEVQPSGSLDGKSALIRFHAVERTAGNGVRGAVGSKRLEYELDLNVGFVKHLSLIDSSSGVRELDINLKDYKSNGYKGTAFFVRATDIFDASWSASSQQEEQSFAVGQHRTDGPWDMLVYVADVDVGCDDKDSNAANLKLYGTNTQTAALDRTFAACQSGHTELGTIKHPLDGTYNVAVSLSGATTAMRLRVAGGLLFNYTM